MKYRIPITRDCTETTWVDVEAVDAKAARDAALEEASQSPEAFEWVADDCSGGQSEPYFAGDDDLDAIEQAEQECGQCEGTGTTDAMGYEEECPVCDGTGERADA